MRLGIRKIKSWVADAQRLLGLQDWRIDVVKGDAGKKGGCDCCGFCHIELSERYARITIDTEHIDSEDSAIDTCYHETAHIALAMIDDYVSELIHKLYPRNRAARSEAYEGYERLREDHVVRITALMRKRNSQRRGR